MDVITFTVVITIGFCVITFVIVVLIVILYDIIIKIPIVKIISVVVRLTSARENEVGETDDMFIIMTPQNAVGNCILDDLGRMVMAAGKRPVIIVNPRLKDMPSAAGVMQVAGRKERMEFVDSFKTCYHFRLLYLSGTNFYPILGALRYSYPGPYEVYKREDLPEKKERYLLMDTFEEEPRGDDFALALAGRQRKIEAAAPFWKFW
ncbi:hypothetical protein CBR_g41085 [Chara braunii]|uniref:DUF1995 domain-containing protein n=1 Tax=Chara braunii TaxID=69332 RepID=A0A388LV94_CHABU|nr:hypothetical protein CBR_g41085 [Chara braunii]|eukprot:GBG86181.1 hypothetical protein CBR_g41085 [Chara braunii]